MQRLLNRGENTGIVLLSTAIDDVSKHDSRFPAALLPFARRFCFSNCAQTESALRRPAAEARNGSTRRKPHQPEEGRS